MPRVYRTQKERERFLILEFVRHLGYSVTSPKWQERPDALLTLCDDNGKKRIAVELTDHFNDTLAGQQSPLSPTANFWVFVESSLMRRISHRKHLTGIVGCVRFTANPNFPTGKGKTLRIAIQTRAKQLAKEIVNFVETHPVKQGNRCHFSSSKELRAFPMLGGMLDSLRISRATDDHIVASRCSWNCSNVTTGECCRQPELHQVFRCSKEREIRNVRKLGRRRGEVVANRCWRS
jgi:hypothetical protein